MLEKGACTVSALSWLFARLMRVHFQMLGVLFPFYNPSALVIACCTHVVETERFQSGHL
jgi:hypothetical protein